MTRRALASWVISAIALACSRQPPEKERVPAGEAPGAPSSIPLVAEVVTPRCADPVPVYREGVREGSVCLEEATAGGLTVVDLSDAWLPLVLAPERESHDESLLAQRAMLLAMARERFGDGPEWDRAREDRFLELYGIFPTPSVVRDRLFDDRRHACHDGVDDAVLDEDVEIQPWKSLQAQRADRATAAALARRLERARRLEATASIDDLEKRPALAPSVRRHRELSGVLATVAAVKAHLRCEGLLVGRDEEGVLDFRTMQALALYQRKHMLVSWWLDRETRTTLGEDSRELDFRTLLRGLRERVVDATGLIEDGSAAGDAGQVVGRRIDTAAFVRMHALEPLKEGAPDRIAAATDAAARALGWIDPQRAMQFFAELAPEALDGLRVALPLPPLPGYHGEHMELRAELDRGDVWYDYPYSPSGGRYPQPSHARPTLTLHARDGDREVALTRMATTIGGWQPERIAPHVVALAYKQSPVGRRIWRDMVVLPVWIPPESTPRHDLVRRRPNGEWALKSELLGPGYASAYGLVMLMHLRVDEREDRDPECHDEGVRTHGSVSYASIHEGFSHGCHRLHNHVALRLASFLLRHRAHERRGPISLSYADSFVYKGERMRVRLPSRGHLYELTPPVSIEVLPGRIRGKHKSAIDRYMPLPPDLRRRFALEP